jgi:hypothetical protein
MTKHQEATVMTLDGLRLAAMLVEPEQATDRAVVLVHGGGVTREEGGFVRGCRPKVRNHADTAAASP